MRLGPMDQSPNRGRDEGWNQARDRSRDLGCTGRSAGRWDGDGRTVGRPVGWLVGGKVEQSDGGSNGPLDNAVRRSGGTRHHWIVGRTVRLDGMDGSSDGWTVTRPDLFSKDRFCIMLILAVHVVHHLCIAWHVSY